MVCTEFICQIPFSEPRSVAIVRFSDRSFGTGVSFLLICTLFITNTTLNCKICVVMIFAASYFCAINCVMQWLESLS